MPRINWHSTSPLPLETRSIMDRITPNGKIMKNVILVAALASSVAFAAGAMTADIDTDGDGMASLAELQVAHPDISEGLFLALDTDADGFVNDDEMAIVIELAAHDDVETDS